MESPNPVPGHFYLQCRKPCHDPCVIHELFATDPQQPDSRRLDSSGTFEGKTGKGFGERVTKMSFPSTGVLKRDSSQHHGRSTPNPETVITSHRQCMNPGSSRDRDVGVEVPV